MRQESLAFLKKLLSTPSPSGFESKGQRVWLDYVAQFADLTETDAYGNAYAILNPEGSPKILLGGHGDELGFMVSYINDDGFLFFKAIGGVDLSLVRGQRVIIHSAKGPVHGVTGLLAIHLQDPDDRKKVPEIHDMFIDIGATSKAEAEKLVRVGDPVTYDCEPVMLSEHRLCARGCDNRIGTFAAAEGLRLAAAAGSKLRCCIVAASTIQEENGLYGAHMAGYTISPDAALIVDVTHATDIPACNKAKHGDVRLGKGPVISVGSANHPVLNHLLEQAASRKKIPLQYEVNPRWTGTDADAFFLERGGIPTTSIGLPNRFMHSPVEAIDLRDLEQIAELLATFCTAAKPNDRYAVKI